MVKVRLSYNLILSTKIIGMRLLEVDLIVKDTLFLMVNGEMRYAHIARHSQGVR